MSQGRAAELVTIGITYGNTMNILSFGTNSHSASASLVTLPDEHPGPE